MIYRNIDEMKKDYEEKKNEARDELKKSKGEEKSRFKKIILITLILIVIVVCVIKIFFGEVVINYSPLFPFQGTRLYKVYVNGKHISVGYETMHKIPIIPYTVYLGAGDFGMFYDSSNSYEDIVMDPLDNLVIDVNSYECYGSADGEIEIKVQCSSKAKRLKEVETKYDLEIIKMSNNNVYKYSDKFINDIGEYFDEKGHYIVYINGRHGFVHTQVYFYVDII